MFKKLFRKITSYFPHETCYKDMERQGVAVFGMCRGVTGGDVYTDYLSYQCIDCPYLTLADRGEYNE